MPSRLSVSIVPLWFTVMLSATSVDFVRDVRPVFEKHCTECQGKKKQKPGLRLDVKAAALKGGDNHSRDIIPGKAIENPMMKVVLSEDKDERMPPKGERLSAAQNATLTAWINAGAAWPDGVDVAKPKDKHEHRSFKPLKVVSALAEMLRLKPQLISIDSFIDAKL